ncbi:MAG: radical SAM protein, partial [Candidatus Margulisiibacteriota bacterium]
TRLKGAALKPCPGTTEYSCCGYWILNVGQGCRYRCSYCILQDYLPTQMQVLFANVKEFLSEQVLPELHHHPDRKLRIGTGEFTDSLVWDRLTELSTQLIQFARDFPQVILELKTKSVEVESLLSCETADNVVVAWSLNPQTIIQKIERGAPSLNQRLKAAEKVINHGFDVAFHFDPIVLYPGYEADYVKVVNAVFKAIPSHKIRWISMGALRFTKGLREIFFLQSSAYIEEMIVGNDQKFRYFRSHRESAFRLMLNEIRRLMPNVYVYLCMESQAIWDAVFGYSFSNNEEFEKHFNERVFSERIIV